MEVRGSVALITGGANGIGEVCARELAEAGAKVVVCDMDQPNIDRVVGDIRAEGGEAIGVCGDVVKEQDQATFVRSALDAFGQLNIVLPSAGIIRDGTMVTTDKRNRKSGPEDEPGALATGDRRQPDRHLPDGEGCCGSHGHGGWPGAIVLISSISKEGQVGQLNYCSTKAAVALMPKILVGEFMLRNIRNIRVVGIAPGYVDTPILQGMNQAALAAILQDVHLGRLVHPVEIARLVKHCVENDAINGTTLEITGGVTYHRSRAK